MTQETSCYLDLQTGSANSLPEQWLATTDFQQRFQEAPEWYWIEPVPRKPLGGKARTYVLDHENPTPLLGPGWPPSNVALDEARLFWSHATLQLIRSSPLGCRWALWRESLKETERAARRREYPILLRQDVKQRFAAIAPLPDGCFHLVEYRDANTHRLIAWRLLTHTKSGFPEPVPRSLGKMR